MTISLSTTAATTLSGRRPISSSSVTSSSLGSSTSLFFNRCSQQLCFGLTTKPRTIQKKGMSCNSMFGLGVPELAVIAGVIALVFGPTKLPEVGRSFGKTIKSFQQAAKEFESELKKEPEAAEIDEEKPKIVAVSEEKQDVTV